MCIRDRATLAAVLPDLRLLRALITQGIDLNHAHAGMTPLLAATRDSWHGRPDAVTTLLANGADPRATDSEGNTPLHHAARSSDPGVAALLRDASATLARVLDSPVDRLQVWITEVDPGLYAIAGEPADEVLQHTPRAQAEIPLIRMALMEGRPTELLHQVMAEMTVAVARHLGGCLLYTSRCV